MTRYLAFAARCPNGHVSPQEYSTRLRRNMAAGGPVFVWCVACQDGWTPSPVLEALARAWARGDAEAAGDRIEVGNRSRRRSTARPATGSSTAADAGVTVQTPARATAHAPQTDPRQLDVVLDVE